MYYLSQTSHIQGIKSVCSETKSIVIPHCVQIKLKQKLSKAGSTGASIQYIPLLVTVAEQIVKSLSAEQYVFAWRRPSTNQWSIASQRLDFSSLRRHCHWQQIDVYYSAATSALRCSVLSTAAKGTLSFEVSGQLHNGAK